MIVAAAAMKTKNDAVDQNIEEIDRIMLRVQRLGAAYLFLGEAVLNGFDGLQWIYDEDYRKHAIEADGKIMQRLASLCSKHSIGLGVGFYEKSKGKIFSSYLIMNETGDIKAKYQRISQGWKCGSVTDSRYQEGSKYEVIELGSTQCLLAICGDLWTEHFLNGIQEMTFDTILWPLYIDYSTEEWINEARSLYCEQVKKINKRTIMINAINEDEGGASGGVMIITGNGSVEDEVEMNSDRILVFEL
ncbi:carbon-nitrogen hydrolase family protein [Paenibacillus aquistagni]|uniref:Predicted amidohydrolase n=1 Tax=Paenibacillus aquistagni TaxID=1852522 RepID=A0A1X7IYF9_9BACL|nr:carbon-nitrogen hydrolase family protein [Paenibacillus aquistagni]SMG20031.1 Predicted amidohydrolase [Paenibacillus aquistagni]